MAANLAAGRRALSAAFAAHPAGREALASSAGDRVDVLLKVATLDAWRGEPEAVIATGRGAARLAAARSAVPTTDLEWVRFADYAIGNAFVDGARDAGGFDTPERRVRTFLANLLAITGEYLVMVGPDGAPLPLRRAVRGVAREVAKDETLTPMVIATAVEPRKYWPDLLRAAWDLAALGSHKER